MSFAKTVEMVINQYRKDTSAVLEKGKRASEFIRETYSLGREEEEVVGFWERMLTRHDSLKASA